MVRILLSSLCFCLHPCPRPPPPVPLWPGSTPEEGPRQGQLLKKRSHGANVNGWHVNNQKGTQGAQRGQQHSLGYQKRRTRNAPLIHSNFSFSPHFPGLMAHTFSDFLVFPYARICHLAHASIITRPTPLYSSVHCLPSPCTMSPSIAHMLP